MLIRARVSELALIRMRGNGYRPLAPEGVPVASVGTPVRSVARSRLRRVVFSVLGLVLAACASGVFLSASRAALPLPFAAVPGNVNSSDLNGDHRPDVIAPEFGTDFLAVRLGDGHGGFGPLRRYPVDLKPSFVTTGDFNHDRKLDVAVSNTGSADVSVLLGNGDGTLQPAVNYPISSPGGGLLGISTGTFSLEAADVNGDGNLDIVTSNSAANDVSVLLGRGDGTLEPARTYPIAGPSSTGGIPFELALGDFDGDLRPDIVTGGATTVTIMLNDGTGGFTATSSYPVGAVNSCAKIGDVNGDRIPDIVATTWAGNAQVLLGNGDGTFRPGQDVPSGGIAAECFSLGDLNHDGNLDLAIANSSSTAGVGNVSVIFGDGHGHFGGASSATYPVGAAPWATALGDYDGDHTVDIVEVNSEPPSVGLLLGNRDGTFRPPILFGL
jgi:hypothetical protein